MSHRRPKTILTIAGTMLVTVVVFLANKAIGYLPTTAINLPGFSSSTPTTSISTSAIATSSRSESTYVVKRVVDGDTIELEDGNKVRYVGVNTPETHDPRKPVQCYGKEASAFNESLVVGKRVRLVKDVSETDRYGRLLRFVYLEDGTFVNQVLLEKGYAEVMTYAPDVSKSKDFLLIQAQARAQKRGLWGYCSSTNF